MNVIQLRIGPRQAVLRLLRNRGAEGVTWQEVADHLGTYHGPASGLLSHLHQQGEIERLTRKRKYNLIYVLPEFVNGRPVSPRQGKQSLLDDMAALLEQMHQGCRHDPDVPHPRCRQCEIGALLRRYEK